MHKQMEGSANRGLRLACVQHVDSDFPVRTLVPVCGRGHDPHPPGSSGQMQQHMGSHVFAIPTSGGLPVLERGLFCAQYRTDDRIKLCATGWLGKLEGSLLASPSHWEYIETAQLRDTQQRRGLHRR